MNNQRLIAQIRSRLKTAIDINDTDSVLRLHGLLTFIQSEYIRELEEDITEVRLLLTYRRSERKVS